MPALAGILKSEVAAVPERDVRQRQRRELEQHASPVDEANPAAEPVLRVAVHHIPDMPGADENVLPPVEVHVEKRGGPRPTRATHTGKARDLGERAVPPVQLQCVALHLWPVVPDARPRRDRGVGRDLRLEATRIQAQHVDLEQVGIPVAVYVADGDRHAGVARRPQRIPGREAKPAVSVVQPQLIRILEVVRHVQVRRAVPIEVGEQRGESEILPFFAQRRPMFIQEARVPGHRLAGEVARAVVPIEEVGVGALDQADAAEVRPLDELVVGAIGREHFVAVGPELAGYMTERALRWRHAVECRVGLVVDDVEIEVAISIHVGDGDRHASGDVGQSSRLLAEMSLPVVHEDCVGSAE